MPENKILKIIELKRLVQEIAKKGVKITLSYGHFNVIHPGHLRFIQHASEQGDQLLIAVEADTSLLSKDLKRQFYSQNERSIGVAAIQLCGLGRDFGPVIHGRSHQYC